MAKRKKKEKGKKKGKEQAADGSSVSVYGPLDPNEMRGGRRYKYGLVNLETLDENVQGFVSSISNVLAKLPKEVGAFELDEISLAAEVSAKGSVSLLGTGGEMAGKGGLTFVFKRPAGSSKK